MANEEKVVFDEGRCKGCGLCVQACPRRILALSPDRLNAKGFHPVIITDMEACIGCAFCATMCPDVVITVQK